MKNNHYLYINKKQNNKPMKEQAQNLAIHLFDMELESINNSIDDFYIEFIGWKDIFGSKSKELFDAVVFDSKNKFYCDAINEISNRLMGDFNSGYWNDLTYNPMMMVEYGGIIDDAIKKQMLIDSGIGVQLEIK